MQEFTKTNDCGDEYMHMDTKEVKGRLENAEVTLDGMDLSILVAIGVLVFEFFALCCYSWCKKKS